MLNRLFTTARKPQTWFRRARWIAFAMTATISSIATILLGVFALGWIAIDQMIFVGFSLMPLLALLAIQALARLQEVVTMRSGGLAVGMTDTDE